MEIIGLKIKETESDEYKSILVPKKLCPFFIEILSMISDALLLSSQSPATRVGGQGGTDGTFMGGGGCVLCP